MNQKVMKLRLSLVVGILLVAAAGFTSCEKVQIKPEPFNPDTPWSLKADIQPIFTSSCVSCHGGAKSPNLSVGKSFSALTSGGYVLTPLNQSRLFLQMNNHHPNDAFSSSNDRLKIQNWVTQGAKDN
jgi:mono/diheme cytochrome c family protein